MKLEYHPAAERDIASWLAHYEEAGGPPLAQRFYRELSERLEQMKTNPERFAPYLSHPVFRRAQLWKFPQIIVFRVLQDTVRVTVVKHERQDPALGMGRY